MPGTIIRRGKSYALALYAGQINGKKRYKWLTFKTYGEAQAAQGELVSHVLAHSAGVGLYGSPRERLGPYLKDWLARQEHRLAPKTHEWYTTIVAQVEKDALGTVPLGKLSPRALEAYYERKRQSGLSTTTVLHHHRMISKALKDAERQDLILKNPAATAQAPRRARVKLDVWTEAQTLLFLSQAKTESPYYPLYLFLVGTGVRIGEALGLTWQDVALGDGIAYVAQTLERPSSGGFRLKAPKTEHSRRPITLPDEVVEQLQDLCALQKEDRTRREKCEDGEECARPRCPKWHTFDLVFCQKNGKPLHVNNIRKYDLYPLSKKLGLPWQRALHNFPHAHGSHLLQRGVPIKVVQERLGHATASFTLSTYAHVLAGAEAQAAKVVSAMLKGARK